jgi:hypothetical protein
MYTVQIDVHSLQHRLNVHRYYCCSLLLACQLPAPGRTIKSTQNLVLFTLLVCSAQHEGQHCTTRTTVSAAAAFTIANFRCCCCYRSALLLLLLLLLPFSAAAEAAAAAAITISATAAAVITDAATAVTHRRTAP